jgi:hypothetical protein
MESSMNFLGYTCTNLKAAAATYKWLRADNHDEKDNDKGNTRGISNTRDQAEQSRFHGKDPLRHCEVTCV